MSTPYAAGPTDPPTSWLQDALPDPTDASRAQSRARARAAVTAAGLAEEPTIGRLVNDALKDVSTLVRSEIELAKVEVTSDVKKAGKGGAMFAVAAVFAVFGLIFLLHSLAQGIAVWLPVWAGYLIVAVLLFLGAAICALVGKGAFSRIKGKPERAIVTTQESIATLKGAAQNA